MRADPDQLKYERIAAMNCDSTAEGKSYHELERGGSVRFEADRQSRESLHSQPHTEWPADPIDPVGIARSGLSSARNGVGRFGQLEEGGSV
jgi:hypothetical protein